MTLSDEFLDVAFRVDAYAQIGTGHIMRCLTLADELKSRGARTTFLGRERRAPIAALLEKRDHRIVVLSSTEEPDDSDMTYEVAAQHGTPLSWDHLA